MLYASAAIFGAYLCVSAARADNTLPQGITCADVVRYAGDLKIPDTRWGRAQAKIIAATLGFYLTNSQLDAAARCLHNNKGEQ